MGEGERRIPAVRGPSGILVYLVDASGEGDLGSGPGFWADDFHLMPGEAPGGSLNGVDHLAVALLPGQMDSFLLFWRGLFGLEPQPVLEVPDPYGLVQSRAMANPDGKLRLTFNESQAQGTATSRFITNFAGAGIQHVAFSTPDAAAAVQYARDAGLSLLAIPPNYYEDLQARLDVDDEAAAGLRRLTLLYDRDAGGEFRHAYTTTFQRRFFFEIAERQGYTGFGAPNAAVRMAAQAREMTAGGTAARPMGVQP